MERPQRAATCNGKLLQPDPNPHPQRMETLDDHPIPTHVKDALRRAAKEREPLLILHAHGARVLSTIRRLHAEHPAPTAETAENIRLAYSAAGISNTARVPFRVPHWTASARALLGSTRSPGEITLANGGLLVMDQIESFNREALEGVARAAANGNVTISDSHRNVRMPAGFTLIGVTTHCPCGLRRTATGPIGPCTCTPAAIERWRKRIEDEMPDTFRNRIEV